MSTDERDPEQVEEAASRLSTEYPAAWSARLAAAPATEVSDAMREASLEATIMVLRARTGKLTAAGAATALARIASLASDAEAAVWAHMGTIELDEEPGRDWKLPAGWQLECPECSNLGGQHSYGCQGTAIPRRTGAGGSGDQAGSPAAETAAWSAPAGWAPPAPLGSEGPWRNVDGEQSNVRAVVAEEDPGWRGWPDRPPLSGDDGPSDPGDEDPPPPGSPHGVM